MFCIEGEVQTIQSKDTGPSKGWIYPAGRQGDSFLVFIRIYQWVCICTQCSGSTKPALTFSLIIILLATVECLLHHLRMLWLYRMLKEHTPVENIHIAELWRKNTERLFKESEYKFSFQYVNKFYHRFFKSLSETE